MASAGQAGELCELDAMKAPTKGLSGHEATASDRQRGKCNLQVAVQLYQVREEHSRVKIIHQVYTYLYLCRK
jgi:hypothetical protein